MAEYTLDISSELCPMTLVKAKLKLEELIAGDVLTIRLAEGEARTNVPQSLRDHGHTVLDEREALEGGWVLVVRKEHR